MADALAIRTAVEGDLPAVRALLVETWHDTYDALLGSARVTEITDSWHSIENLGKQLYLPHTSFLIAEDRDAIVGHVFANAEKAPLLVIARLYVLPARQRRGIGRRLLLAAIDAHPGSETLRLEVEADNAKGVAFYRREGFVAVGERTVEGIPHFLMEKPLSPRPSSR